MFLSISISKELNSSDRFSISIVFSHTIALAIDHRRCNGATDICKHMDAQTHLV